MHSNQHTAKFMTGFTGGNSTSDLLILVAILTAFVVGVYLLRK